ncbi:AAA family ATPase [Actinomycetospora sp. C-140]
MIDAPSGSTMIGRDDVLGVVLAAARDAGAGTSRLLLVTGEPGMGKTRLLREVAARCRDRGMATVHATCWSGDGVPAFWPWTQVVRACGRELADLRGGAVPGNDHARFALFEALAAAISAEARHRPLLIAVDDLHWADLGSVRALAFVAAHVAADPVLLVAAYRDAELDPEAVPLLDRGELIALRGLGSGEVAALMASTTGTAPNERTARTVTRRTGGNPLFVRELAALSSSGTSLGVTVPGGIRAVLTRRLSRLSAPCRELLGVAAVVGVEFDLDVVATAGGTSWAGAAALLEEAAAAGLAAPVTPPSTWAFVHALVRDTLDAGLSAGIRAETHRAVAGALRPDADVAVVADHLALAVPVVEPEVAAAAVEAAGRRAASALAFEDAAAAFARAAGLRPAGSAEHVETLLALGAARAALRGADDARTAFSAAAQGARGLRRGDLLARAALGDAAGLGGFEVRLLDPAQLDLLDEALAALPAGDSTLRVALLARLSVAVTYTAAPGRQAALAEESLAMARRLGDDAALVQGLVAWADAHAGPDHTESRLAAASEIVDLAAASGDVAGELLGRRLRVVAVAELGDTGALDAEVAAYSRLAEPTRQPIYTWYPALWAGSRALREGRLAEALDHADEAAAEGDRVGSRNARMLAEVLRLNALTDSGRLDDLAARYRTMLADLPEAGWGDGSPVTKVYLARVDPEGAGPAALADLPRALETLPRDSEWLPLLCTAAEVLHDAPDPDVAARVHELLAPYRDRCGVEGINAAWLGSVRRHLGMVAAVLGRGADAEAHLAEALERNTRAGAALPVAHTHRVLAEVRARAGLPGAAASAATARELYGRLDLPLLAAHCAAIGDGGRDAGADGVLRRDGQTWTVGEAGERVTLRHVKGLTDLARLVAAPDREFHALDLVGGERPPAAELPGTGDTLDETARQAYRRRIAALDERIEDGDPAAERERDHLVAELSRAYGLGGRARPAGRSAERARTAVTWRIRDAITRIEAVAPGLGKHLRSSVRTGTYCVYAPEQPRRWLL